jgi:hypothetical protein
MAILHCIAKYLVKFSSSSLYKRLCNGGRGTLQSSNP